MYELIDKILCVMRDYCRQNGIKLLFGLGDIRQAQKAAGFLWRAINLDVYLPGLSPPAPAWRT
jgi:hypothetical protein